MLFIWYRQLVLIVIQRVYGYIESCIYFTLRYELLIHVSWDWCCVRDIRCPIITSWDWWCVWGLSCAVITSWDWCCVLLSWDWWCVWGISCVTVLGLGLSLRYMLCYCLGTGGVSEVYVMVITSWDWGCVWGTSRAVITSWD